MTHEDPTAGQADEHSVISADTYKEDSEIQPELAEESVNREELSPLLVSKRIMSGVIGSPLTDDQAIAASHVLALQAMAEAAAACAAALGALGHYIEENKS